MVLHGVTSYSMPANNQYADFRRSVLTALKPAAVCSLSGSRGMPSIWMARSLTFCSVRNTATGLTDAAQAYEEIAPFMRAVSGRTISGHEILQDNVRRTTYDNGAAVTVNYNDYDVVVDGETIAAKGYKIAGA